MIAHLYYGKKPQAKESNSCIFGRYYLDDTVHLGQAADYEVHLIWDSKSGL